MTDPGLGVLIIPCLLVAGLVLVVVGVRDRDRPGRDLGLGRDRSRRLRDWMTQAGIRNVTAGQLVAFCAATGLLAGVLLLALSRSPWIALAFAVLAGYLPLMLLKARQRRCSRELQEVWPDAIDHLASGVRAGLSLPEALVGLAERGPEPLRPPFAAFADSYHASGSFAAALDLLKAELADPTADRVVEALRVAREVGGTELGRTLRTLSAFLRDEYRVRRELEARQSWVQVAARLSFATPWLVLLLLATKPEAVAAYRGPGGALVIGIGAAMATAGYRLMLVIGRLPQEERVLR